MKPYTRSFLLATLILASSTSYAAPSTRIPAWQQWAENPEALSFAITGYIKAVTNTPVTISIATISQTNRGWACNLTNSLSNIVAPLKPYCPYKLTVQGTSLGFLHLDLIAPSVLDLTVSRSVRGIPNAPKEFKVFVDGAEQYTIDDSNSGGCTTYSKTFIVEIRPDNDVQRRNSAGANDDSEVPEGVVVGDAGWPELGPGKSSLPEIAGIKWNVSLGRLNGGKSAGRIHLFESGLSSNTYMPQSLIVFQPFTNHTEVTVVTTQDTQDTNAYILRQIMAPQAFVDISGGRYEMELRFYLPTSISTNRDFEGLYTILTNDWFVTWRISNPDESYTTTKRIRFEEIRNGTTNTSEIGYDNSTNVWTLRKGSGPEQVTERRAVLVDTNGERWETNTVEDASGVAYKAVERYHLFDWGWELAAVVTDPVGAKLTNTFSYYTNTTDGQAYGKVNAIVYPDGFWEKRLYYQATTDRGGGYFWPRPWIAKLGHVLRPLKDDPASPPDTADTTNCFDTEYLYMEIDLNNWGTQGFGVALGKINQR